MRQPTLPLRSNRRFARITRPAGKDTPGEQVTMRDGRRLWLRSIEPGDVDALRRCFTRLSEDEIRMRFMHYMRELPLPMARQLCHVDPECEIAWTLIDDRPSPDELRGVGRIFWDEPSNQAEFAVLVEKAWTGLGLGALLMQRLVDECRRREVTRLWGFVLIENRPMLDLCRQLGFKREPMIGDPGTAMIALDLD